MHLSRRMQFVFSITHLCKKKKLNHRNVDILN